MNRPNPNLLPTVAVTALFVLGCVALLANENANSTPTRSPAHQLKVFPDSIELHSGRDAQSIVVQFIQPDGITTDVTKQATLTLANPQLATINEQTLQPLVDGETELKVEYANRLVTVPVVVTHANTLPAVSFTNDVMPVFSKMGCNTGNCHGASRGKDGFRLSLFGFDPQGDYYRLTREMLGRRIDLATPDDCLLMNKATGAVPHSGGKLFESDSAYYQTLLNWLQDGAPGDHGKVPAVTNIELFPPNGVLNGAETTQQLNVRANYADGSSRDVTSLAYFSTNNDNSATVSPTGLVTAKNRGEAFVMARFDTHTVGSDFIVLPAGLDFQWEPVSEYNYIDSLIHNKLKKLRIQPSPVCTDAEFIRRLSIDICGQLPTPEEVDLFLNDPAPDKRSQLVDQLLERKGFSDLWVMKWSELLQVRSSRRVSYKATLRYYEWLQSKIANNVPVDEMIAELITAKGGTFSEPATNFYQVERDSLKISENVAQVFLGMRIQCAQCHNHPFDRWTMEDYYGFAAFFSQIGRKQSDDPREMIIYNLGSGEVNHPVAKRPVKPKFLGGDWPDTQRIDRRKVLAEWITSRDNPYFARNLANIVWAHFLGRGIVDEVDDVRVSNPPVNEPLLAELANRLKQYDYDFKKLIRDICNSRTYQLSTQTNPTNESDRTHFSHAHLRRIRAEVLLDMINQVTETRDKFPGLPRGSKAVQIADGKASNYFLSTFGRTRRESVCSCEVKTEPNLSQALHLINGETLHRKIPNGATIKQMLNKGQTNEEIITEIYVRSLSRQPTETELKQLSDAVATTEDRRLALEDLFWAILNSKEFIFNH